MAWITANFGARNANGRKPAQDSATKRKAAIQIEKEMQDKKLGFRNATDYDI